MELSVQLECQKCEDSIWGEDWGERGREGKWNVKVEDARNARRIG